MLRPPPLLALLALLHTSATARAQDAGSAPDAGKPIRFEANVSDPLLTPLARPARVLSSFEEARQHLLARSTDLRSAEAAVLRAEGRTRQSLAALLPNARASLSMGLDLLNPNNPAGGGAGGAAFALAGSGVVATAPLLASNVTVTQSVVDVSSWRGLDSAEALEKSARANLEDVQRRTLQGLARALVAVFSAERAAELNREGLRLALERAALSKRTLELGAGTQLDLVRIQQDVAVARGAVLSGDEQVRRAREALGLSLGFEEELGVAPTFALGGVVTATSALCAPLDGGVRADLLSAAAQTEAASKSTAQANAGYLPNLGLSSSATALTTNPGPVRVPTWNVLAVISVPIWEGGLRGGLVKERLGLERQAEESALALTRNVSVEVARARRGSAVAASLTEAAKEARDLADRADDLTRRSFEIGRATSLELVQSANVLRQAELSLAFREFELVQARLDAHLTESSCER